MSVHAMGHGRSRGYFLRMRKNWRLYVFLLLPVCYLIIFKYWPMLGAQIAFRQFNPAQGIFGSPWVGLKYFEKFFNSYQFERVLRNTLTISLYGLAAGLPVPILLALMLNAVRSARLRKISQNILYTPNFISVVVVVGMLMQIINPVVGLYAKLSVALNGSLPPDLMANPSAFPHLYIWSGVWQSMGWNSVIYFAALAAVSPELHEAALIDGATRFQRILHVDFPALLPTVVIMLILSCGNIMTVGFEKVYLMQTDLNLRASELISTYVYKVGLTGSGGPSRFSSATAIGLFNSLVNLVLISVVNAIAGRIGETSLW
ncbi:sugar ABC transporter permease [Clostridia bacterium]|nr:sugar ABC transporter permease [Clostridia bacterium]